MAIIINDNYGLNAGKPLDSRYFDGLVPWADEAAVNAGIVGSYRYIGLTVNIAGTEYWYKDDVGDVDLIEKESGAGTITGATNGLHVTGISGDTIALGGDLTGTTIIDGQGLSDFTFNNINDFQVKTSGDTTVLGVDEEGFLLSFSGGSVTFDDGGGLKYGSTGYSSGYTTTSIPDVHFVTGLTSNYLKLDQTIPQNVIGSQPVFDEGISFGITPSAPQISGHTKGRAYYDEEYETISIDIGDISTLQLGQESLRYVYNPSGSVIPNGSVVSFNGIYSSGNVDTISIKLAIATGATQVVGITTQDISGSSYGFVTLFGYVNDLNTSDSNTQYSGVSTGSRLYLSATNAGEVTDIEPLSPNIGIFLGGLVTKDATVGKIYVNIHPSLSLNDLSDVSVPSPATDNVLTWNGIEWVDAAVGATSAGSGVNFYYATPVINSITGDAGISEDGTTGNGIQVATFSRIPVTTGATLLVAGLAENDIRAFAAWGQDAEIGRTQIDSGLWEFYDYANVSSQIDETYIIHGIYQVVDITGSTITTTGTGILRTATITNSGFTGTYFNGSATNTEASYLQTPSGIFQISAVTDVNNVTIITPAVSGYTNESGVSGSTWNILFTGSTEEINVESPTINLYQTKIIAPAFAVDETDKLGQIIYTNTNVSPGSRTLTLYYNGTDSASFVITPFVTLHNDLPGLQGGSGEERYHITEPQAIVVGNTSGINTGDETKSTIENKLIGEIFTHWHPYSGLTGKPDLSVYQTVSGFTGYTASTQSVIDDAFTGATNIGGGPGEVYSGSSGNTAFFRTIVGSGDTQVTTTTGGTILIYSTSGGSDQYFGESPSAVDLCGISIGYELTGKTVSCIIQDMLVPELFQTSVGTPSTSAGATFTGIQEIGYSVSQTITPTYTAGAVTPLYCTDNGTTRGGAANNYNYSGPSVSTGWNGQSSCIINPYTVVSGVQTWNVCTRYDEGACIKGSKGTVNPSYPTVCAQDSITPAGSVSVTGILPWYWGSDVNGTITSTIITGGTKTVAVVGASTPITFNAVTEYLWFAAPAGTTSKTKWWVCAANAGNIGGTGELWAAACTVAVTSGQGCWSGCNYDVYVTCGITTTATGVAMCLYY